MTLIIHELKAAGLTQTVTPERNTIVTAIRPHIYRHLAPTGSLKLELYDDSDVLVAESENVEIPDIGTMDYFHGYVRFYINAYLKKDVEYTIKLVGEDGYTFNESAFCGWANGFDLAKYPITTTPTNSMQYPLDLEIWERTEK